MKSIWNGSLSFGLVSIPIRLYSVAQEHTLGFKMLCGTCNNPIAMRRWCQQCKKEVTWEHVVKGLEIKKGEYFVITKEVLKSLKPVKSTAINIHSFVDISLVDPVYFNTHYYAAPEDVHKAYTLFQYALGTSNKVAIGSFVMRDREQVCMVQSYRHGLLMTTLYYEYEVRPVENIQVFQEKQPSVSSQELKLAQQLIGQLTQKTFDMSQYKDTFAQELKKMIKQKKEGKIVHLEGTTKTKRVSKKSESLMEVLKASLMEEKRAKRA
jgi:DNA end-binding protein Ku